MLEVEATAEEPLALGVTPEAGNVVDSWALVPGSVLRGALAAAWIAAHGPPASAPAPEQAEFRELFDGELCYGPLLADCSAVEPLSVRRCKYQPTLACQGVVFDAAADPVPPTMPDACAACGGPLAPGKGTVAGLRLEEVTRTALTDRGTASKGELFTRRQVPAGTTLRGRITGRHRWLEQAAPAYVWLGGRRSTGGRARLRLRPADPPAPRARHDGLLLLRFEAPGIFVDDAGRAAFDPPVDELAELLGTPVELRRRWRRPVVVGGWHAASQLPKPADHAVAAGSAFLLAPNSPPLPQALARLARRGIGLRRCEGFGQLTVNPPAWTPPVPPSSPVVTFQASSLVGAFRAAPGSDQVRDWLRDHLHERAEAIEHGTPTDVEAVLGQRRLRGAAPTLHAAVRQLLELSDPELLGDAVALLEDPAW